MAAATGGSTNGQEQPGSSARVVRLAAALRRSWDWARGRERDRIFWFLSLGAALALAASLVLVPAGSDVTSGVLRLALIALYVLLLIALPRASPRVAVLLRHVLMLGLLALLGLRAAGPAEHTFLFVIGLAVAGLAAVFTSPWAVLAYTLAVDAILLIRTWPVGLGPLNLGTVVVTGLGVTVAAFIFGRAELLARQQAQVLQQSAATLEARVAERTEQLRNFIAAVSHDLRTPLSNIQVYAEAELQSEPALPDESRLSLQIILDETAILVEHVNNLLYAAQIDADALRAQTEPLAADELVADAVARVRARFLLAQRKVCVTVPADLPAVRADVRFARMILNNLLDNAHKYSPPPATIEIGGSLADGHVCIHVRDHGRGIPSAERAEVFERFRRGRAPGSPGLGLGLWICRELARHQGGDVAHADAPGGGSTFTLSLPVYAEPSPARE